VSSLNRYFSTFLSTQRLISKAPQKLQLKPKSTLRHMIWLLLTI